MALSDKPAEFMDYPEALKARAPFGPYRAVVSRIVDGDTLVAILDFGFNAYHFNSVRLLGVDAPELFRGTVEERARGKAAREFLVTLMPPGTPCVLHTAKDPDAFGRYLARVELADGRDVGTVLIAAGHAEEA